MTETRDRRNKIEEMLSYIETRLSELNDEKEELAAYQALDKKRKIFEYAYFDKELRKAKCEGPLHVLHHRANALSTGVFAQGRA